jgi:hypothetical protein
MIQLDANNPAQVAGATVVEADLGQPDRKMIILSGTAIPQWEIDDDGNTYRETAVVNLRRTVLAVEQATVAVGLASIGNDDSTFLFAADSAGLDIDPVSQELLLTVNMALQGSHTGLARFGYQVVAIVTTQATGISGTIRWARDVFDASGLTLGQQAQLFGITANRVDHVAPPGGFAYDQYTPLASGVPTGFGTDGNDFTMPYEIPGAPYNQPLVVQVQVGSLFQAPDPVAGQTGGPNPVVLTIATPGVTGVDFRIISIVIA